MMNFNFDERCDFHTTAKQLADADQNQKIPANVRALMTQASRLMLECEQHIESAINTLEYVVSLRAGLMDSESKQVEVMKAKDAAMTHAAMQLRRVLETNSKNVTEVA